MDGLVIAGVALVAGAAVPVAPWETLATLLLVGGLVWVQPRRPARWILAAAAILVAVTALRATCTLAAHERRRDAAAAALPVPARCTAQATVADSPVAVRGTLRWVAALSDVACDGRRVRTCTKSS